jgi:hypothetical protein
VPRSIINMVSGNLSMLYGIKGPNLAVVTACTTGTHSIGLAGRLIAYGDADVMLAGGAEMATTPTGLCGFAAARALSVRNDEPEKASRPWDKDRDGFVLSDGAGVVMLEEYEHAKRRGARIHAELIGFGMSGDAYHMTLPSPGRRRRAAGDEQLPCAMRKSLPKRWITSTPTVRPRRPATRSKATPPRRCLAIMPIGLAMSSTKSMTGHLLGAAGGVEAIFSVLAIRDQVAPPTINLDEPEPGCDLNYVPHQTQERRVEWRCPIPSASAAPTARWCSARWIDRAPCRCSLPGLLDALTLPEASSDGSRTRLETLALPGKSRVRRSECVFPCGFVWRCRSVLALVFGRGVVCRIYADYRRFLDTPLGVPTAAWCWKSSRGWGSAISPGSCGGNPACCVRRSIWKPTPG